MKGSIRQRGTTWTVYWFTTDPATGKRLQHTKGGFERKEPARPAKGDSAREYLNSVVGKVQDGSWRKDSPLTVKELLEDHWLPAQRLRGLRPATLNQYENVVDHWLVPYVGATKVNALRPAAVTAMVQRLRTDKSSRGRIGLSPRSAQITVGVLKAACKWAVENELIARNPVVGIQRPRVSQTAMRAWSAEQARAFLTKTRGDRLAVGWALLLTRGLRRGELCGLRWENVDLTEGVLQINETRVVVDGKAATSSPKTGAGRRSVPLDPSLVAFLRTHKAKQGQERWAAGESYEGGGYVVADELGRPYHPDTISAWFDDAVKAAELPRIRLHDARHTAASLMLASGVPTKVVSELLGHASPTITLAIYAHVLPGMAEEAGAALSASLLG